MQKLSMVTEFDVIPTIIGILFLVIPAMLLGKLCSHFKISEVIGFVIAGVLLGPFALGGLIPFGDRPLVVLDEVMLALWQMSGIIILFAAGLHFTFHDLIKAGYRSVVVGIMGVVTPLALGYLISNLFGFDWTASVIIGVILSATSITVTVTILDELRKEKTTEGNILVNAAVLDDILGLAVLSAAISIVTLHTIPSIDSMAFLIVKDIGFWILILLASVFILPKIVHGIAVAKPSSLEIRGTKQATAIGSAFGLAAIAAAVGLNPIVGAFAAGMGLAGSKLATQVREFIGRLKVIVEPLFFSIIGAHVSLNQIQNVDVLFFIVILVIAVFSKIGGCGIPAAIMLRSRIKGLRIGYGMVARGEIAFIAAGIGLALGVIDEQIYSTMIVIVLATIFVAPTMLRFSYRKNND
jgi:Kef-type K+ transport system membrane component KefB